MTSKPIVYSNSDAEFEFSFSEAVRASFISNYSERYEAAHFMSCVANFFFWKYHIKNFWEEFQVFRNNPDDCSSQFREMVIKGELQGKLFTVKMLGRAAERMRKALESTKDKYIPQLQKLTLEHFIRPYDPIVLKPDMHCSFEKQTF